MNSPLNQGSSSATWGKFQQPFCESLHAIPEAQKFHFRRGPLFHLRDTVDSSQLLPGGKLVRSTRLARLEAVLLISKGALSASRLAQHAGLVDGGEAQQLIELLNKSYDLKNSAFRIERTATGFLMMTRPALVSWLDRLHMRQAEMRLSQPMMETLTIIGYQQPVTRATVEAVRGVQSAEMIRQLIDRGLVKVGGEEDSLGRPFLYITTRAFLDMFGLGRIEDLPDYETIGRQPDPQIAIADHEIPAENNHEGSSDAADEATLEQSSPEDQQAA